MLDHSTTAAAAQEHRFRRPNSTIYVAWFALLALNDALDKAYEQTVADAFNFS